MKNLLIISILITILNCAPTKEFIPQEKSEFVVDFSKYSKQNFLFTPYQYSGKYKSSGMISISFMPEAKLIKEYPFKNQMYQGEQKYWQIQKVDLEKIIESFHKKAISMGANAIITFKINSVTKTYEVGSTNPVIITGVELTGFAIKRLDVN